MTKSRFPDSLVLILAMIVVAQIATLILPAGEFERDGRAVIPGTYERLADKEAEAARVGWVATPAGRAVPLARPEVLEEAIGVPDLC